MSEMTYDGLRPERHPLLRLLIAFPVACFCCALATDIAYVQTMNVMWVDFSTWLLAVGMAFGGLAALVGLVVAVRDRNEPGRRFPWAIAVGSVVVLALALLNNFVHSRDAWVAVMPQGLTLSALVVVAIVVTNWLGGRSTAPAAARVSFAGARR